MSELLHQMDEITRKAARERAEQKRKQDLRGLLSEIVLAFILAGVLDLFCC